MESQTLNKIIREAIIESSSDLVVALYQAFQKTNDDRLLTIDPIYRWEYMNPFDSTDKNIEFISKKLINLDDSDYEEVFNSYNSVLKCMFEMGVLNKMFPMDENDPVGWKIFKELQTKLKKIERERALTKYNLTKESNHGEE